MRGTLSTFNEVWQQQLRRRICLTLEKFEPTAKIVLGCSGGMDSMLLFHLLGQICPERLIVVSVDHQLQAPSAQWSAWVAEECAQYQIPCYVIPVQVAEGNVESAARQARYAAFLKVLKPQDVLVLAHHQQDQAETALLRLLSGTGVAGLAAMKMLEMRQLADETSYWLWRPLLDTSKEKITQWVQQLQLSYIDDPMNHDRHYDRVWAREQLWPVLQARFPAMQDSIARCSSLMQDANHILQEVLLQDAKDCCDGHILKIERLKNLSEARQRQLLSFFLQADQTYKPSLDMVERLQREVIDAREDAQAVLHFREYDFVRYAGQIYRYTHQQWLTFQATPIQQTISFRQDNVDRSLHNMGLSNDLLDCPLTWMPRQGGEKIKLYGRGVHRPLKKIIQDAKIPPWFRHQIQILMYHNVVLGVMTPQGFWLADHEYCATNGWLPQML